MILLGIILVQSLLLSQDNPFISKKPDDNIKYPYFIRQFVHKISKLQHELNQEMAKWVKEIKQGKSAKPFFIVLFITFIYGVIHALTPGHGKTVTFSYFLSERAEIKKGIIAGTMIGFLHAGSAILLVIILYFILHSSLLRPLEDFSRIVKLVSYGLITIIGLFLLLKTGISQIKQKVRKSKNIYDKIETTKSIIPFAIAVGMIPCPGALIILIFSISMDIFVLGIISSLFMALGMATTVSFIGILSILARKTALNVFVKRSRIRRTIQTVISLVGAVMIIIIGLFLFTGTL